ncbi:ndufs4 NADH dehydrogenase Fe-S protein subunit [Mucor velutinosus]|uniref:ribonuclease H n=1 Tax=Mucor velutinosus TaxID=708070 RepID=A0AAN7DHL4_9FUNG|nr:ndufs4 NADH dehydrogenase Fe-S protein subunit [Mucor velutinosus]
MGRRRWRPYGNRGIWYIIHTDGACINNGRPWAQAGFGIFWGDDDHHNVSERLCGPQQTNQRAEAQAVLTALEQTDGFYDTVEIRTDSIYVVRAVNEWCYKWESNGWVNAKGLPVANQSIFKEILYFMNNRPGHVYVKHVPGHAGIYENEMADELAREGANMDSEDENQDDSNDSNNGCYYD